MSDFYILVDSGCDLSLDFCERKNIIPIKLQYCINEKSFMDSMQPEQYHEFYEGMRAGSTPKTSQINTETFLSVWKELLSKKNIPILNFTMSSGISGTNASAVRAVDLISQEFPGAMVHVVDTKTASIGEGMLAIKASEMREAGKSFEECVDWAEANKNNVNTFFTTDNLSYLYRSGRVSRTGMVIAHALGINPILRVNEAGKLVVSDKVRGKKQTVRKLIQKIKEVVENPEAQTLYISHADVKEEAEEFAEEIMSEIKFKDVMYTTIGPSIGSHCGPGVKTAFFFGKNKTP